MADSLLQTCFDQPDALPSSLLEALARALPGEQVRGFALADLDRTMRFAHSWLVLCDRHLVIARPTAALNGHQNWDCAPITLTAIDTILTHDGLSACRLSLVGTSALLAEAYFTRRQEQAMSRLKLLTEQARDQPRAARDLAAVTFPDDATLSYRDAVLSSVTENRGLLATRKVSVLLRLLGYLRPHRRVMIFGMAIAIVITALGLVPPLLSQVFIDDIVRPVETGRVRDPWFWLWGVIGAMAAVRILSELLSFVRLRLLALTGEKVARRLREDVYAHLHKQSLSFFVTHSTGSLITRVSSDTDRLWDFITFGLIEMVVSVLQVIGVAAALLAQNWQLALMVLIPIPIMAAMFYWHSVKTQVLFLRIWRRWSAMSGLLSDVVSGIRLVKAFSQEERELARFRGKNDALEVEAERLHREWTRFWPSVVMLMHLSTLIVWGVGGPQVLRYVTSHGQAGMPLGVFMAFVGYMWMFWLPVQNLGMMTRTVNRVSTSASRVFEVLDTVPTVQNRPGARVLTPLAGHVQFAGVTFSYDGVRNVLRDVSFDVAPGEMIGLVGPSGSGKTTIVNLICRFWDVKAGAVRLDHVDVRDLELSSLRRQIGIVPQEPYLFHGTIAENIAYGKPDARLEDIIAAARAANAHEFITSFPDAYDTMVGERGQTLSGGERQRISIARALLHDPKMLILDEATSSVDSETEGKIQDALARLVKGRTTFAIAHRLSTLKSAHRLFVMKDGVLAEQGTHADLCDRQDGVYAKLYHAQTERELIV
ncbi:MAG: ABC transporter ATP-binding protein [Planctomycetota bacterium]